jgi:uncharacterized membrane protein
MDVHKDMYQVFWKDGLEPELITFFDGLNWLYIIMLVIIFYGLKHTDLLDWAKNVTKGGIFKKYTYWLVSALTCVFFIGFRFAEGNIINAAYISSMLRSMIFTVIFSNIFVDIPVYLTKVVKTFVDTKAEALTNKTKKDNETT